MWHTVHYNSDNMVISFNVEGVDSSLLHSGVGYIPNCKCMGVTYLFYTWYTQSHPHVRYIFCVYPIYLQLNCMFAETFSNEYQKYVIIF